MPTLTAAQKRAAAKVHYDAFLAGCPAASCSIGSRTSGSR